MFVYSILDDMGVTPSKICEILTDSQAGRDIVVNPGVTKHTVHFERWLYYARELYLKKKAAIALVPTEKMRADDKTKVVHKSKFEYCRKHQLNLKND